MKSAPWLDAKSSCSLHQDDLYFGGQKKHQHFQTLHPAAHMPLNNSSSLGRGLLLVSVPCQSRMIETAHKGAGVWRNKPTACHQPKTQSPGKHFHQVPLIKDNLWPSGGFDQGCRVLACVSALSVHCMCDGVRVRVFRRAVIVTQPDEENVRGGTCEKRALVFLFFFYMVTEASSHLSVSPPQTRLSCTFFRTQGENG